MDLVKVYIFDDDDGNGPYWREPNADGGWPASFPASARMIPREQHERWKAATAAWDQARDEMTAVLAAGGK